MHSEYTEISQTQAFESKIVGPTSVPTKFRKYAMQNYALLQLQLFFLFMYCCILYVCAFFHTLFPIIRRFHSIHLNTNQCFYMYKSMCLQYHPNLMFLIPKMCRYSGYYEHTFLQFKKKRLFLTLEYRVSLYCLSKKL